LKCPETGRGTTSYPVRHFKNRHHIDINADYQALPLQPTSFFGTVAGAMASAAISAITQTAGKLILTMNIVSQIRQILSLPQAKPVSDSGIQVELFIANRFTDAIYTERIPSLPTGFSLFRPDSLSSDRILSLPTGFCLFRPDSVYSGRILSILNGCRTSEAFQVNLYSYAVPSVR
jgi:hypothetical protein